MTAFENMEAKRLLGPLSDETIEELGEKTNFIMGIQLRAIKQKKNPQRKLARCSVRTSQQQTREKIPPKFSGDLEKWTTNTSRESSGSVGIQNPHFIDWWWTKEIQVYNYRMLHKVLRSQSSIL